MTAEHTVQTPESAPDEELAQLELLREFLVESYENLDRMDRDFLALEKDPTALPVLSSIFRTIHTIKGTCGFLGLEKLEALTHVGENLLSQLRDGLLSFTPEIADALLLLGDATREILGKLEMSGAEGGVDYSRLIGLLEELTHRAPGSPAAPQVALPPKTADAPPPSVAEPESRQTALTDTSVRVDVGQLERLMNLVGELVLARNQVLQLAAQRQETGLLNAAQRLNLITTELQEGVMKTRMQPIGSIWSRFPRVVRDLAVQCGKQVRLEMEGTETELDRTVLEAIKDPMTHLLRNAVDHGIENPAARVTAGKQPEGCLTLRAFHESGLVNVEVTDDGAGISPERIKGKARERGLITADQAAHMSDRDALRLIFLPGFSTAAQVTSVSGRGVGMDVVKTNVEKIGGTLDLSSQPGKGSSIRIRIPLTLAIIPGLVVTAGGERFVVPQISLVELVLLRAEAGHCSLTEIGGSKVLRRRGELLPLLVLSEVLGLPGTAAPADLPIVVVEAEERKFGLIVDSIRDTEEIVVKPLGKRLKSLACYAGATIMGDGQVALILDVTGLAQANSLRHEKELESRTDAPCVQPLNDRHSLLLFRAGESSRLAVPLSAVQRLEEFPRRLLEFSDGAATVQYRGEILPLVWVAALLGKGRDLPADDAGALSVIVVSQASEQIGLVVDGIVDAVEEEILAQRQARRPGLLCTGIVAGAVTDVIDLPALLACREGIAPASSARALHSLQSALQFEEDLCAVGEDF